MREGAYLGDIRCVRRWACEEYEIAQGDIELMFKLHELEYFTWGDFYSGAITIGWDKKRWFRLRDTDWIKIHRKKAGKNSRYHIYCLTRKANTVINKIYRILDKKDRIPDKIVKRMSDAQSSYSTFQTASAIKAFNKVWDKNNKGKRY